MHTTSVSSTTPPLVPPAASASTGIAEQPSGQVLHPGDQSGLHVQSPTTPTRPAPSRSPPSITRGASPTGDQDAIEHLPGRTPGGGIPLERLGASEDATTHLAAVVRRLGTEAQIEAAIEQLKGEYARQDAPEPAPQTSTWSKSLVAKAVEIATATLKESDWAAGPRGLRADKPFQDRIAEDVHAINETLHLFQTIVAKLDDVPRDTKVYLEKELQAVIDVGKRLTTDVSTAKRAGVFTFIAAAGGIMSLLYPHLANERVAQVVVDSSLGKSFYTNIFRALHGTAGGPEAMVYFMQRYLGFSAVSMGLMPSLVPKAVLNFTHSPGWASAVGFGSAAAQTYYFAGDGAKKWMQRKFTGNPEIDNLNVTELTGQAQDMLADIAKYLKATASTGTIHEEAKQQAGTISATMNGQVGDYRARLADVANKFNRLVGEATRVDVDKDRAVKLSIWGGAVLQLLGPVVLSALQKATFLTIDSTCVAIAIGIQGFFKALDPATNEAGMVEWFRQMMTFSVLKTIFLGVNKYAGAGDMVSKDDNMVYIWTAIMAVTAMTFGGAIGKGFGAGTGFVASRSVKVANAGLDLVRRPAAPAPAQDVEVPPEPPALQQLEHLLDQNLAFVRQKDPTFADTFQERRRVEEVRE